MNPGQLVVDGALWVAIPLAILAGLVSFVSPCVLPLVPGYLGYLGSTTTTAANSAMQGGRAVTTERGRLLLGVSLFIAGFTVVFVAVTILGGTFGYLLLQYANVLTRVFGVVIIALGLVFLGFFGIAQRTLRPRAQGRTGLIGAPLLGFALGVGLALPFLLIGFIPALRRRLPKPGPWMERFRRWMALPMGLTALALAQLLLAVC